MGHREVLAKRRQRYRWAGLLSFEKPLNRMPTPFRVGGRQHGSRVRSRVAGRSCVVEEPAHAEKQHAREPGDLRSVLANRSRPVREGQSRTADMHALEESDCAVVPMNQPNKEGQPSAEAGEGRAQTKENIAQSNMQPDTERGTSVPGIERCATSSKGKEAGTVHRFAPPSDGRSAAGQLLRLEAASCAGSGWRDVAGV